MPGLIYCPHCRGPLQDDGTLAGQSLICPRCNGRFDVPGIQAPPAPASSAYSTAVSRRFKQPTSVFDIILDFRFEKYLTPLIIRATWIIALVSIFIYLIISLAGAVMAALPEENNAPQAHGVPLDFGMRGLEPKKTSRLGDGADIAIGYAARVVAAILFLLWLRVALEAVIVVFNMAESLSSIDRKTAGR